MNFLVSNNNQIIAQFQKVLMERDHVEVLPHFPDLLIRGEIEAPSLAVIDITAPGFDGDVGLKALKMKSPSLKILLIGQPPPMQELAALAAGAMGCCAPGLSEEQIHRIITIIEEGGVWISNLALPQLLDRLRKRSQAVTKAVESPNLQQNNHHEEALAGLTQREREISQMVAEGLSNKIIARKLEISDRTVKAHLTTVFQKLNIHDRLQLALFVTKGEHE